MRQMGKMNVEESVAGSFNCFHKNIGGNFMVFYVASLVIIMSLIPWNQLDLGRLDKSSL